MRMWHLQKVMVLAILSYVVECGNKETTPQCSGGRCEWQLTVSTWDEWESGTNEMVKIKIYYNANVGGFGGTYDTFATSWVELKTSKNDFSYGSTDIYTFDVFFWSKDVPFYHMGIPDSTADQWQPKRTELRRRRKRSDNHLIGACEFKGMWVYKGNAICCDRDNKGYRCTDYLYEVA